MIRCSKCGVIINAGGNTCPLCGSTLNKTLDNQVFPQVDWDFKHHNLLVKLLLFLSLTALCISCFVNLAISHHITWAWFVGAGIISFWFSLSTALKERKHFIRMLFAEMLIILLISVIFDYKTGWHKWSVSYCLPFLTSIYMLAILIMRLFLQRVHKDFTFYATINSLIGLIPGIFIITNYITTLWPSYISVILSIVILVFMLVFNKRQLANELERRLHI